MCLAYSQLMGLSWSGDPRRLGSWFALSWAAHALIWAATLWSHIRPAERALGRGRELDAGALSGWPVRALLAAPWRVALAAGGGWALSFCGITLLLLRAPELAPGLPAGALLGGLLFGVSIGMGAGAVVYPVLRALTSPLAIDLLHARQTLGMLRPPGRSSAGLAMLALVLLVSFGPALFISSFVIVDSRQAQAGSLNGLIMGAMLVITLWAPFVAIPLMRSFTAPIKRIARAIQRMASVGRLDPEERVDVAKNDELGHLAADFNDLLEQVTDLAHSINRIAEGDLEVEVSIQGDLSGAVNRLVYGLRETVGQLSEASTETATMATQLKAVAHQVNATVDQQSDRARQIHATLAQISSRAAEIGHSASGVTSSAERSHQSSGRLASTTQKLLEHTQRIDTLLETVLGLARRSDILAINASLEAVHAGEAGKGFLLVASQMGNFSEQVSSSVVDVRRLVRDISTYRKVAEDATEAGRQDAQGTLEHAHQIHEEIQAQQQGAARVSETMEELTSALAETAVATTQIDEMASALAARSRVLEQVVAQFRKLDREGGKKTTGRGT